MKRSAPSNLLSLRQPRPRFARSINVERDVDGAALDAYLPVGRALDAIDRLANLMLASDTERALSITGPYGSGKSSLAVLLDALLSGANAPGRTQAFELLNDVAPSTGAQMLHALEQWGASKRGFLRCVVTAQRESVARTVVRALFVGLQRYVPAPPDRARHRRILATVEDFQEQLLGRADSRPDTRNIRELIREAASIAPIVLLIDEFGKNLEAFADSHSDADLFLLQDLAEWSRGSSGIPLVLVTLQHMAFDDYAAQSSQNQRREWSKIQGRFEDLPFVDSPEQTRALVAATFATTPHAGFDESLSRWSKEMCLKLRRLGLSDIADADLLAGCWPLHPLALLVLPDLCHRYGQNERTLFSFLAGTDPRAVPAWLQRQELPAGEGQLPSVLLDTVYDFFIQSATSLAGASTAANRWLEIDTRIRDSHGLTAAQRRVVRAIGLLNLVSTGGSLRASKALICWVAADGYEGTSDEGAVARRLRELEESGLVTYRDFADEFRVWQGSDFDIKTAVEAARQLLQHEPPAALLSTVQPLSPAVAARHSHEKGTLRTFSRIWADETTRKLLAPTGSDTADGLVLYALGDLADDVVAWSSGSAPVLRVQPQDAGPLRSLALEVAALQQVQRDQALAASDWVARRELEERAAEALARLDQCFEEHLGHAASKAVWSERTADGWGSLDGRHGSAALSLVADATYFHAPHVQNDLLNKRELTSQAAKARRELLAAMITSPDEEHLGIEGFGPERAMYESVLARPELHRVVQGEGRFQRPPRSSSYSHVWDHLFKTIQSATRTRLAVSDLYEALAQPPYGVRAGLAPVLLLSVLMTYEGQVALYEHGTYRPSITPEISERLLRNPSHFELKHFASRTGPRSELISTIGRTFSGATRGEITSLLAAVSSVVSVGITLPPYSKQTGHLRKETREVRACLLTATEPDVLLFEQLPKALGFDAVGVSAIPPGFSAAKFAKALRRACDEIAGAYAQLLHDFRGALAEALGAPVDHLRANLAERARMLQDLLADQNMRTFVAALVADIDGDDEWIEYVAMMVGGSPPESWTDDDRRRAFARLVDVAGTFTRLSALHHAHLADSGAIPFDAFRMAITHTDGTEDVRLLAIDGPRRDIWHAKLLPLLTEAAAEAGSFAAARDELLAAIAQLPTTSSTTAAAPTGDSRRRRATT
jgi:energy-coupling factor transporter ATP-binding protein EcfA2